MTTRSIRLAAFAAAAITAIATPGRARAQAGGSGEVKTVESASSFDSTLARLERAAVAKGLTVALKLDHAAAAKRAGLPLRPTTLVIAGNPAAGTPLMQADQTIGVELPLRFLVWQGEDGRTRVSYDPIKAIASRHKVAGKDELLARITGAIEGIVANATK
ncbi:MAG TPA: DUF302 domain-containing protein [Gemmatimonadaceae bacterium]|nr:DUF302 domain-containing protein [Gemmatimonadaceae bacterium]